ncbi:flagellar assembly protein FliW [Cohnella terricola]|uniref:Flagellar assembly factor FliW n=1 Tax=Cohnella terricola TaxID=1289167 RepID=A0A559J893_9BACL|nr:flagellar assembly protein FliW [Cohnella terricola]TVX96109.1 flagellar assembly protein FliW [Cohnella terricola]
MAQSQTMHVEKLDFVNSIVGFEHCRYFNLEKVEGDNPFFILKSDQDPEIEFVLASPFEINREYEFEIGDEVLAELEVQSSEDLVVLAIVTINNPFANSTINLFAPLVINVINGISRQIILNGSDYQIRALLQPAQYKGDEIHVNIEP